MLQNAYFLAKIGADTAENEQHFAEILPIGRRRPPGLRRAVRPTRSDPPVLRSEVAARRQRLTSAHLAVALGEEELQFPQF